MASLNGIGLTGWQLLVARALELAEHLKQRLEALSYCKVLNLDTAGPSVVWWVLPKGRDAKQIFEQANSGKIPPEKFREYASEIRHLFDQRAKTLDPAIDARLGFTTSTGYCPHGLELPAWKAVFFNPKTNHAIIDQLIANIEELV